MDYLYRLWTFRTLDYLYRGLFLPLWTPLNVFAVPPHTAKVAHP